MVEEKDLKELLPPLRWCAITREQVISNGYRLDASAYDIDAMEALACVHHNPYGWVYLWSEKGLVKEAYHGPRAKRNYLPQGIPFIGSSEVLEVKPNPIKFVDKSFLDSYGVKRGQVLLSCSGTIGRTSFVNRTLEGYCVSQHALKITADYAGYVYAYLSTEVGRSIVKSFTYGAVIDEIEPEHLTKLPIPNAPEEVKRSIHEAVVASYDLRDQSNDLIDEAQRLLYYALGLPAKMELKPQYYAPDAGFRCFTVKREELNNRFDASYHVPEVKEILSLIAQNATEVTTLGDSRVSKEIILPGRFKRIYVEKGKGVPFFGGKQLLQLDLPDKYLSNSSYSDGILGEICIKDGDILISARGTIGKSVLAYPHWIGGLISDNIIRLNCAESIRGYIYAYLNSWIGQALLLREVSGSVVDVIEPFNVSVISIPLLKDASVQLRINDLVLEANALRYKAYLKEQEALQQMEAVLKA